MIESFVRNLTNFSTNFMFKGTISPQDADSNHVTTATVAGSEAGMPAVPVATPAAATPLGIYSPRMPHIGMPHNWLGLTPPSAGMMPVLHGPPGPLQQYAFPALASLQQQQQQQAAYMIAQAQAQAQVFAMHSLHQARLQHAQQAQAARTQILLGHRQELLSRAATVASPPMTCAPNIAAEPAAEPAAVTAASLAPSPSKTERLPASVPPVTPPSVPLVARSRPQSPACTSNSSVHHRKKGRGLLQLSTKR